MDCRVTPGNDNCGAYSTSDTRTRVPARTPFSAFTSARRSREHVGGAGETDLVAAADRRAAEADGDAGAAEPIGDVARLHDFARIGSRAASRPARRNRLRRPTSSRAPRTAALAATARSASALSSMSASSVWPSNSKRMRGIRQLLVTRIVVSRALSYTLGAGELGPMLQLQSAFGVLALIAIAWALSERRGAVAVAARRASRSR